MIQHGRDNLSKVLIRFYLVPDLPIYAKWLIGYMECNPRVSDHSRLTSHSLGFRIRIEFFSYFGLQMMVHICGRHIRRLGIEFGTLRQ